MKPFCHVFVLVAFAILCSCSSTKKIKNPDMDSDIVATDALSEVPYYLSVREVLQSSSRPSLESFAMGRQGDELLMIGGRIGGFHGTGNTAEGFHRRESNKEIIVLNIKSGEFWTAANPKGYEQQFSSTNTQHCQNGDTLWIAGGFGIEGGDIANATSRDLTAVSISAMISAVKAQEESKLTSAILYRVQDDFVQVTGGEMLFIDGWFYLVMGQHYTGQYTTGNTGNYTDEVRVFKVRERNGVWSLTSKNTVGYSLGVPNQFHRRDLNVLHTFVDGKRGFGVYGGVFDDVGDGWLNPIHFQPDGNGSAKFALDTTRQLCNNYSCASISIYDSSGENMYVSFLGGIGHMQYDKELLGMVVGDGTMRLPWVETISTLAHLSNGTTLQHIQMPDKEPKLPTFLGAEAAFVPVEELQYEGDIMDFAKCTQIDSQVIGYMYGGIRATAPSSNNSFPTLGSNGIFEVILHVRK